MKKKTTKKEHGFKFYSLVAYVIFSLAFIITMETIHFLKHVYPNFLF